MYTDVRYDPERRFDLVHGPSHSIVLMNECRDLRTPSRARGGGDVGRCGGWWQVRQKVGCGRDCDGGDDEEDRVMLFQGTESKAGTTFGHWDLLWLCTSSIRDQG